MLCAKIIKIGSSLLKLFNIKLVTYRVYIQGGPKKSKPLPNDKKSY